MANNSRVGYGLGKGGPEPQIPPLAVVAQRNPTKRDTNYELQTIWINEKIRRGFVYLGHGTWQTIGITTGAVATLSGDTGAATPSAGNINIRGTTGQIISTASGDDVILSLSTALTTPGSVSVHGTLHADSSIDSNGNVSADNNIIASNNSYAFWDFISNFGNLRILNGRIFLNAGGIHSCVGTTPLVGGTALITTDQVASTSLIFLTNASPAGTPGILSYGSIIDGVSFVINSTSATDTSSVNWWIIN